MMRPLTGRDAAAIMVVFFAVVIAVNLGMARLAGATFGGKLAENGYVASQDYNQWIRAAERQERLGWTLTARIEDGRLAASAPAAAGAVMRVTAVHPLGRAENREVAMSEVRPGEYRSVAPLPAGRWQLHVRLSRDGREARFIRDVSSTGGRGR